MSTPTDLLRITTAPYRTLSEFDAFRFRVTARCEVVVEAHGEHISVTTWPTLADARTYAALLASTLGGRAVDDWCGDCGSTPSSPFVCGYCTAANMRADRVSDERAMS